MYVLFPADEVVHLSYGRVLYVPPHTPSPTPSPTPSSALHQPPPSSSVASSSASPSPAPVRPPRALKPPPPDRRLSYSDYLALSRDKAPRSADRIKDKSATTAFKFFAERPSVKSSAGGRRRTPTAPEYQTADTAGLGANQVQAPDKTTPTKKKAFFSTAPPGSSAAAASSGGWGRKRGGSMAAHDPSSVLKDLTHPAYNEQLKTHNGVTFKLVRTVSDFTQQLSQMYEQHAQELQSLVANFRKKNGELRKERPACPSSLFHTWENLLQEVEIDSQALGDIASILGRQVSRPLLERSFHRKIQARKVFTHRESYETIIAKTEEKLVKCRQDYKTAYLAYLTSPSTETLSTYFNTHNAYVQQLHATNGMLEEYGKQTLPSLLQELEDIYNDLCETVGEAVQLGAEVVSARAMEQCKRYDSLVNQCRSVSGPSDLSHLARALPTPPGRAPATRRLFVPPQPPPPPEPVEGEPQEVPNQENIPPPLKNELVIDRLSAVQVKPSHDALRKEALDLEAQIRQIQEALDTLLRIQQRSVEAALYNKANELQDDISMKRFDLQVAQIHLSAIIFQKELFTSKLEGETGRERKMSSASTGSMKNKWLKAFKSLKTPPPETEKKNGSAITRELLKGDPDAHNFQENTYKKITPCDVCSQVLRGHTRQGLKCRICKMNVHLDCQEKAAKCQTKARLLRRQKSTSEIETRVPEMTIDDEKNPEVDQIYQVLKQATEISNSKSRVNMEVVPPAIPQPPGITVDGRAPSTSNPGSSGSSGQSLNRRVVAAQPSRAAGSTLAVINPAPCATSSDRRQLHHQTSMVTSVSSATGGGAVGPLEATSMRRRLFAGMKSLTGFGSRSRHGSPGHRSISLPEKRNSQDASGTRPFGQPLCLGPTLDNGDGFEFPPTPPSPSPSKGKASSPIPKKTNSKTKK